MAEQPVAGVTVFLFLKLSSWVLQFEEGVSSYNRTASVGSLCEQHKHANSKRKISCNQVYS